MGKSQQPGPLVGEPCRWHHGGSHFGKAEKVHLDTEKPDDGAGLTGPAHSPITPGTRSAAVELLVGKSQQTTDPFSKQAGERRQGGRAWDGSLVKSPKRCFTGNTVLNAGLRGFGEWGGNLRCSLHPNTT